ncbi:MAG TPA: prepilin-type N-terminal cleavage/methylation domain-containing protein, partial [Candidatus Dormibacteraeota bacterium]|nr:prepilin-type N-terminal cleavage/methylation domain-containing protein [Candidatus Dormibacteraeota bacterium]
MERQRGFTLIETMVALGIAVIAMLGVAGILSLSRSPGAVGSAGAQLDASIALARALARASGNGATILALPRVDARGAAMLGFRLFVYRGRPTALGAATATRELPIVGDATLREASLGSPPFALFFRADGSAVGIAHPALLRGSDPPQFTVVAREPGCPIPDLAHGITLTLVANGATLTRVLPCPGAATTNLAASPLPSMTPNPPLVVPRALLFKWPSAPVQSFVVAEFGYERWFAASGAPMQGFACEGSAGAVAGFSQSPPYSGPHVPSDGSELPLPPAGTPYAYPDASVQIPGAMDDAPATFPTSPIGAGLCTVPLGDAFGQRRDVWGRALAVSMQVMGFLTLTNASGASATSQSSTPLPIGSFSTKGQTITVRASKSFDNDGSGIRFANFAWSGASAAPCGAALAYAQSSNVPGAAPGSTATASFSLTDTTPPTSALTCTGTITDTYGEPAVTFTASVAAGAVAMKTWPAQLVMGASGMRVAMTAVHPFTIASLVNELIGGAVAQAALTPCTAYAWTAAGTISTPIPDTPIPTQVTALIPGLAIDSSGCITIGGAQIDTKTTGAPIVAYEPSGTAANFVDSVPCTGIASSQNWNPTASATNVVSDELPIVPGSTAGGCPVTINDSSST